MKHVPNPLPPVEPRELKVLIVDDESMLRSVIADFLRMLGYAEPVLAADGREALNVLRTGTFDCMISDIKMPEMTLDELLGKVHAEFPHLIVIATSGYSDFENALNIIDRGAHDFLGKPLNLDSLETALRWVVQRRPVLELARELFGQEAMAGKGESETKWLDRLSAALLIEDCPFRDNLRHAQRVADMARLVETLPAEEKLDLTTAALLHEMGSSYIMQSLCEQPRRLDDPELHLVRAHAQTSGRLVANSLQRPDLQTIIAEHIQWSNREVQDQEDWSVALRLSVWLGLLNYIDGCLRDRPDRTAFRPKQVRESLHRRFSATPLRPIGQILEQWKTVENYYGKI